MADRSRKSRALMAVVPALLVLGALIWALTPSGAAERGPEPEPGPAATVAAAPSGMTAAPAQAAGRPGTGAPPAPAEPGSAKAASAAGGSGSGPAPEAEPASSPEPASAPLASASASRVPRPRISKRLIPYGPDRQADMADYSKRHYGKRQSALTDPKLIVIHYAEAGSIDSIYNTFAPNRPDVEYNELPGTCSHYAVGSDGTIARFVPESIRCRHVVGLNHVAIGIEHVGFSDGDVLGNKAELKSSLKLTQWIRCRYGLGIKRVIGHNESLRSPFYLELDPDFRGRTHSDFPTSAMRVYRKKLRKLGAC